MTTGSCGGATAKPGDRLVLEFPVAKAGRYKVSANLTKAVDYGIVKADGE